MKALVVGMGLQGKAVVHDLEQSPLVREIVAADLRLGSVEEYLKNRNYRKTRSVRVDATKERELAALLRETQPAIVICMLPPEFGYPVGVAALTAGIPFVNSSYAGKLTDLDQAAREKGVSILPEMGLDPGIDLVLARLAVEELDEVRGLYSYGTGLPEPVCARDNALQYKITWTFDGVLKAYKRPARFLREGKETSLTGEQIFRPEYGHNIEVPDLGTLEAYPNGDAIAYIQKLNLGKDIQEMGRFALRYPGHREFWRVMVEMGFLEDTPIRIGNANITPHQFLIRHLTPRLQFRDDEKDMVMVRVVAWGSKGNQELQVTRDLIDFRDLETGLFAMNRTVGFTTSLGAQMILEGTITAPGVLSPTKDVPPDRLLEGLRARGMQLQHYTKESC